jgi:hypothetical protein
MISDYEDVKYIEVIIIIIITIGFVAIKRSGKAKPAEDIYSP